MASGHHFIVVLCLTSGLWIGANAKTTEPSDEHCVTCPPGWTQFGHRCFLFQFTGKTWAEAERFCNSQGGNLASLQTAHELDFIRQIIFSATMTHRTSWVGGYDAAKEGVWLWSDGSKFVFNRWGRGEPNNHGGKEHCMEINFAGRNYVNDAACFQRRSFVCARDPE